MEGSRESQGDRRMATTTISRRRFLATDRKSTRLNSSHSQISYAVFCLKKKNPSSAFPSLACITLLPPAVPLPNAEVSPLVTHAVYAPPPPNPSKTHTDRLLHKPVDSPR